MYSPKWHWHATVIMVVNIGNLRKDCLCICQSVIWCLHPDSVISDHKIPKPILFSATVLLYPVYLDIQCWNSELSKQWAVRTVGCHKNAIIPYTIYVTIFWSTWCGCHIIAAGQSWINMTCRLMGSRWCTWSNDTISCGTTQQ